MMMSLGLFVFKLSTLPYQNTNRQVNYGWGRTRVSDSVRSRSFSGWVRKR